MDIGENCRRVRVVVGDLARKMWRGSRCEWGVLGVSRDSNSASSI